MTRRAPRAAPPQPDTGLGFSDPPELDKGRYDWQHIAEECRKIPGEWYHVFTGDKRSISIAVMQDKIKVLSKSKGFEATTRNNNRVVDPPTCDLYVRYVPAKDRSN